jgi:predicted ATP-dependent endonuclease of OLD family
LVHLLESTGRQIVLATHSSEVITEADPKLTTLVEKSRRRALRAKSNAELQLMSSALGSAFNLRLAKALKSQIALFVEGDDMSIVTRLARTLGFQAIAGERGITVIPLKGYSRWGEVTPFSWLVRDLLSDTIRIFVILDRDYRPDSAIREVEQAFAKDGIAAHVWRRKELESYLLTRDVVARLAAGPSPAVDEIIDSVTAEMEDDVFSQMLAERIRAEVSAKRDATEVTKSFRKEFAELWRSPQYRLYSCPAKRVLSGVNGRLAEAGFRPMMVNNLAAAHRLDEIAPELSGTLRRIEEALSDRGDWLA